MYLPFMWPTGKTNTSSRPGFRTRWRPGGGGLFLIIQINIFRHKCDGKTQKHQQPEELEYNWMLRTTQSKSSNAGWLANRLHGCTLKFSAARVYVLVYIYWTRCEGVVHMCTDYTHMYICTDYTHVYTCTDYTHTCLQLSKPTLNCLNIRAVYN